MITKFIHVFLGNEKPQFKDLENYVVIKYATIWKQLGINLNINEDLLNLIEKDNPSSCENCCSKMLSNWLDLTPEASWGMLLDAVDKLQEKPYTTANHTANKLPDTVEKLDTAADKLPDTVEKLDTAADKLPDTVEKLDTAADKLFDTVEQLDTAADKLPDTVEKLDTVADKLPDIVEELDTAADKLPDTVEKLDKAADKLPKVVNQLWEVVDKLPKTVGKMHVAMYIIHCA